MHQQLISLRQSVKVVMTLYKKTIQQPVVVIKRTATGGTIAVLMNSTKSGQTYLPSTLKPSGGVQYAARNDE